MRLQAIFFLLMTFRALLWAQATPVEAFTADRGVNAGATGVMIVDLRSGDVLAELNPDIPLIPASVTKAVTIAALLRRTGTG